LTNLIVLGKIAAAETVLILIFYQKVPSQTISYKIINIFACGGAIALQLD
jgi:hypothetical protein